MNEEGKNASSRENGSGLSEKCTGCCYGTFSRRGKMRAVVEVRLRFSLWQQAGRKFVFANSRRLGMTVHNEIQEEKSLRFTTMQVGLLLRRAA